MPRVLVLLVGLLVPSAAIAASLFLNGVNIDSVRGQTFENCKVEIDANGNVYITAKGYAVKGVSGPPSAPATSPGPTTGVPAGRYWLVTEKAAPGLTQYDIDLFVNSKWVRKFLDVEEHVVLEITKYLQPGANKIQLIAKKDMAQTRRSASPQHFFRIVIGEGNAGGRNVMISKKAVDYKRTAAETQDFQDEFTLVVQ